jgi:hypothetical protein
MKKYIFILLFQVSLVFIADAQWNGTNPIYTNSNVGIGTTSPSATASGPLLEISSNGDFFPVFRLERINGVSKTDRAWETFISSNGSYYIRDVSTTGLTDPFIIQTGAPTNTFNISSSGNIGIGTTIPDNKLHVFVGESGGTSFTNSTLTLENNNSNFLQFLSPNSNVQGIMFGDPEQAYAGYIRYNHSDNSMRLWTNNSEKLTILSNGNVLIGKTQQLNTNYLLDVNGTIRANEIKVNIDGADFVFESEYKLRALEEVESFVKENKHLPEIEPANEMEANGAELGELNSKLLQKIEELTLYMIEMNTRMKTVEKENSELKEKVAKLESAR